MFSQRNFDLPKIDYYDVIFAHLGKVSLSKSNTLKTNLVMLKQNPSYRRYVFILTPPKCSNQSKRQSKTSTNQSINQLTNPLEMTMGTMTGQW